MTPRATREKTGGARRTSMTAVTAAFMAMANRRNFL